MNRLSALEGGRIAAGVAAASCVLVAAPAPAQTPPAAPSENLAINLIQLLVKQGVISRTAADLLLKQAELETAQAQAQAQAAAQDQAQAGNPVVASPSIATLPPAPVGTVRVPYVPQVVRDQIRDEIKGEVMAQAKAEGWAQPGALPDWLGRISFSGDLRLRDQFNLYSRNNANDLLDYSTFNASGPTDINPNTNPGGLPYLNTRSDQIDLLSIRARFALNAKLSDHLGAGLRLATGDNNGAVSTTGYLGGGFDKKNIWLDRAFLWIKPTEWSTLTGGRMPNPFQYTDLLYSDDLNFDGVDAKVSYAIPSRNMTFGLTGGAFPIDYQSQNFPANSSVKAGQSSKWLFAGQAAFEWNPIDFDWKTSVAYYDFDGYRGQLSSGCDLTQTKQCSTDFTRPEFMQKGNTLFLIRDILAPANSPLNYAQPQYVGLSFGYALLDLNTQFDYRLGPSKHLVATADYVRNLAYNASDICRNGTAGAPVNNLIPSALGNTDPCSAPTGDTKATFRSGPNAWLIKLLYGDLDPTHFGEWNISVGYRYIQPDALVDAFNSADFDLGGTNAQGYTITATMGLYDGAYLQGRWFSANEVYGPPLAIDVGQLELHIRF